MDERKPPLAPIGPPDGVPPVGESDLHAYADGQLGAARAAEVERYLDARPDERERVERWQRHNAALRELLDPVRDEPLPPRLLAAAQAPHRGLPWGRGLAAGFALVVLSAGGGWLARGAFDVTASAPLAGPLAGFARRAAVAHAVYSRDARRPVEVAADQEQQLVTWLSKRLGVEVRPPKLGGIGYALVGGRLLPGESGPVAQFMYQDAGGQRLTLYVTHELPQRSEHAETAFRFGRDGAVNVFYWVDRGFGYALSGAVDRAELMRVSQEVYRQLGAV
ncbi:MAG TPA: anti-sigma factor [Ideonella sp.]|nr:anti-sigma factor [Ideonella sp.]